MSSSSLDTKPLLPGPLSPLVELNQFSKIKLIVFDLDGTLLKSPNDTPGERLVKLGRSRYLIDAKITVATGRTYAGARSVLTALGETGHTPVVLYNGSIVLQPENKRLISHRSISSEVCNYIIDAALRAKADVFVYQFLDLSGVPDFETLDWENFERVSFFGRSPLPGVEFNGMPVVEGMFPISGPTTAILILPTIKTEMAKLTEDLSRVDEVSVTSSGGKYIELRPKGSSKAVGMADLAHSIGLGSDEILAVGDNDNDVELLQWAGIGVAVKGASSLALRACTFETRFGAERGAIEVLDLVRRAKRLNPIKAKNERKR